MTLRDLTDTRYVGLPRTMGLEHLPALWSDWLDLELIPVQVCLYFRKKRTRLTFYVLPGTTAVVWAGPKTWSASAWLCCNDLLLYQALSDAWCTMTNELMTADFSVAIDRMIARIPRVHKRPTSPSHQVEIPLTTELELE